MRKRPALSCSICHASKVCLSIPITNHDENSAQIGADARKLLRHQNQGAVPFAVLMPLLLSCIDVAKKYSQEVAKGGDVPQTNNSSRRGQDIFQTQPNTVNLLEDDSDHEAGQNHTTAAQQMGISHAYVQQFADEAAAFADLSPNLLQPTGTTSTILQQAQMPVDPNWFEIIVRPQWISDTTSRPDMIGKPRMISTDKLRKIESSLTNLLVTAKPGKNIPPDSRLVRSRQLKCGTFSLRTASSQGLDHLVDTVKKWTDLFGPNTEILIPTYSVKIYSIKRASFTDASGTLMDEPSVLNALITASSTTPQSPQSTSTSAPSPSYLLPGSVASVRWGDLHPSSSQHSCILIDFRNPESANTAVRLGLTWSHQLHKPQFLHPEMDFIQCDRCLQYTHKEYSCDNHLVCELCAGQSHSKHDCPSTGVFKPHAQRFRNKQCANCGQGHSARFEKCAVRLKEHARAKQCRKELKSTPFTTHPYRGKPKFLTVASPALYSPL